MSNKIKVMSKQLSELIAAGEVIERPSSIVKELVENSIDAGATSVTIEIKEGGISYLRISDNGSGISFEDIPTAFLRHATSKLYEEDDLDKILTLGFRGEALASISAVSKVDVISKRREDDYGTHYKIEGVEEKLHEKSGCPDGTTIVVKDLFFNVPARLKFLKKPVTEGNAISAVVNKLALSHPEISFKYIRDNRQELLTAGDSKLFTAIYTVLGKELATSFLEVNYENQGIKVTGYICKPTQGKSNRAYQNFFINNRYVKSNTCTAALEDGYKNSIMVGKFPSCVLNLELDPAIIDVNVHPAKIEVRFSSEKLIFDSVYFAVKNALLKEDRLQEFKIDNKEKFTRESLYTPPQPMSVKQTSFTHLVDNSVPKTPVDTIKKQVFEEKVTNEKVFLDKKDVKIEPVEPIVIPKENPYKKYNLYDEIENPVKIVEENKVDISKDVNLQSTKSLQDLVKKESLPDEKKEFKYLNQKSFEKKRTEVIVEEAPKNPYENFKVMGEIFSTYILVEVAEELILVDKHAAHERVLFEKIIAQNEKLDCQMLISPLEITLTFEQTAALEECSDLTEKLGFILEFDKNTAIIKGIPLLIGDSDPVELVIELSEDCLVNKSKPTVHFFDDLFHSVACKSAIKGNIKSEIKELEKLVELVFKDDKIRYCPHGRPVMIKLSRKELEKQFFRTL